MTNPLLEFLTQVEERAGKATPEPWNPWVNRIFQECPDGFQRWTVSGAARPYREDTELDKAVADMEFIAHSRTDIPTLCKIIRELAGALDYVATATEAYHEVARHRWVTSHRPTKFAAKAIESLTRAAALAKEGGKS